MEMRMEMRHQPVKRRSTGKILVALVLVAGTLGGVVWLVT